MSKELINLFLFIGICFVVYILFKNFNYKEGMTDASGNVTNGIASNAAAYAALAKSQAIKLEDQFLISKYSKDYETTILNLDEYLNDIILNNILNINLNASPEIITNNFTTLGFLNQAKTALNNAMKYIDSK
jgi:hypothetical protein